MTSFDKFRGDVRAANADERMADAEESSAAANERTASAQEQMYAIMQEIHVDKSNTLIPAPKSRLRLQDAVPKPIRIIQLPGTGCGIREANESDFTRMMEKFL